jgi:hypothetical protein
MVGTKALMLMLGLASLSACSPYVYNQEITTFSNGVNSVVSSYQTGEQAVDTLVLQQQQAGDAASRARLILLPGCNQMDPSGTPPKLPDCDVVTYGTKAPPAPTSVQKNLTDAAPAFNALKAYAAALTAVTAAGDDTTLNQATTNLTTAANGLAGAVAKLVPAAAPASSLVSPIGSLISQGITIYLDQRRYNVLRNTVPALDPDVQALGQTVQAALLDIRAQQLLQLGTGLRSNAEPLEITSVGKLSESNYQTRLAGLEAKISAFNQARAADPTATVTAMVNAHHQLALALQANTGQGAAVLNSMQNFAALAEKLNAAAQAASSTTAKQPAAAK